jgi:hypothetical protein
MGLSRPRFVPTVQRIERAIGGPIEQRIGQGQGVSAMLLAGRLSRRGLGVIGWARGAAVHTLNLPTAPDVRDVKTAVARLETRLEELCEQVAEIQEPRR